MWHIHSDFEYIKNNAFRWMLGFTWNQILCLRLLLADHCEQLEKKHYFLRVLWSVTFSVHYLTCTDKIASQQTLIYTSQENWFCYWVHATCFSGHAQQHHFQSGLQFFLNNNGMLNFPVTCIFVTNINTHAKSLEILTPWTWQDCRDIWWTCGIWGTTVVLECRGGHTAIVEGPEGHTAILRARCGGWVVVENADSSSLDIYGVIHNSLGHIPAQVSFLGISCHLVICTVHSIWHLGWPAWLQKALQYIICIYCIAYIKKD